jgi:hypothetical protein
MKRVLWAVVMGSVLTLGVQSADAQKGKKRPAAAKAEKAPPTSEGVAKALGELKWGMTKQEVLAHFVKGIEEKYQKPLSKATDAMSEDRLRHEMGEEIQVIRDTLTKFDGKTTGWDVSFLRGEFTHKNDEEMFMVRDANSQNFYFFIQNKLWKWYKAFDASVFSGQTFEQFAGALGDRYGKGADREGKLGPRGEIKRWLEWTSKDTRLRAVDENKFYGFYCMVFESKDTLAKLNALRAHTDDGQKSNHALVDAVTTEDGDTASVANEDIVDRVTGQIRNRKDQEKKDPKDKKAPTP